MREDSDHFHFNVYFVLSSSHKKLHAAVRDEDALAVDVLAMVVL